MKTNTTKAQHNMCWTPQHATNTQNVNKTWKEGLNSGGNSTNINKTNNYVIVLFSTEYLWLWKIPTLDIRYTYQPSVIYVNTAMFVNILDSWR